MRTAVSLAFAVVITVASSSCLNLYFEDTGDDPMVEQSQSRTVFYSEVLPLLESQCAACHGEFRSPSYDRIGFFSLDAGDEYLTILTYSDTLIDRDEPNNSGLVTKGVHDGPSWRNDWVPVVLAWLQLDHDI